MSDEKRAERSYRQLAGIAESQEAIDQVIGVAERTIRIFDISLSNRGFNTPARAERLREFLVKGFLLNDRRFKEKDGDRYFDELLQRIRDIRSSEKVFWRKVLEIYATSEDYNPTVAASKRFFTVVQNKMHWAAHGHTAAEIIHERADASKRNMGLTNYPGDQALKSDAGVAKNYLNPDELDVLNRIVSFYLDFAELQAMNKRTMTMAGWIAKLDEFLQMTERDILNHAGSISHDEAIAKADAEYEKWRAVEANRESAVEADFARAIKESRRLDKQRRKKP